MQRIYKYPLLETTDQMLTLPKDAKILTVQSQHDKVCLWAIIDDDEKETEERHIEMFGTGHKIPDIGIRSYLGTVQFLDGSLVFHVFVNIR